MHDISACTHNTYARCTIFFNADYFENMDVHMLKDVHFIGINLKNQYSTKVFETPS